MAHKSLPADALLSEQVSVPWLKEELRAAPRNEWEYCDP